MRVSVPVYLCSKLDNNNNGSNNDDDSNDSKHDDKSRVCRQLDKLKSRLERDTRDIRSGRPFEVGAAAAKSL